MKPNSLPFPRLWALSLAILAAAACGPPAGMEESPETPVARQETPKTASSTQASTGTMQAQAVQTTAGEGNYNPENDPLVNPKSLLEPPPKDHPEWIAEDETLIRTAEGSPNTLNPIFVSTAYDNYAQGLIYDGLFGSDAGINWFVNKEVVDFFAENDDHTSYSIRLKPGLKWQDGEPWTSRDFRFSWQAIMDDEVPCPAVKTGTDEIADVKVIDDRTFEIVFKRPLPTNKWNASFPVLPEHIYGNPEERAKDHSLMTSDYYNRHNRFEVVGNGPYKLVEWIPDSQLVFERWEDYHGTKPHFKKVILKIIPDINVALLTFKKQQIDEMELSTKQFATQTNDEEFAAVGNKGFAPFWLYSYIGWNMDGSNPFFTDRRVRVAMAHAANIPMFIDKVMYNLVTQAHGVFSPGSWMYNPDIQLLPYDLDAAASQLDEAGWMVSPEDGWRYKTINGTPVKFEFTLQIPQGSWYGPLVADLFAQDLKKIGVSMLTQTIEWATFVEMNRHHDFQAQISAWGSGTDPDGEWNLWRSDQYDQGRNYGKYGNPRVDELLEMGRKEFDREKRARIYQDLMQAVYDDQPYLFLFNRNTTWAFNKRLRGIGFCPLGIFSFYPGMSNWWVHTGEQMYK